MAEMNKLEVIRLLSKIGKSIRRFMIFMFTGCLIWIFCTGSNVSVNYSFERTKKTNKIVWSAVVNVIKIVKSIF